jgi:hypothetical protein
MIRASIVRMIAVRQFTREHHMRTSWAFILIVVAASLVPAASIHAQEFQYPGLTDRDAAEAVSLFEVQSISADPPRFEFSSALIYLKPGSGSLEYGTLVSPLPPLSPHWENQAIDPNFSPAFNIGARYMVPETGNDLRTSWTHLDSTDGASFVGAPDQFAGPSYLIGPGGNAFNIGVGSVNFRYDAVNFEAGHLWRAGQPFQVRVFGGVQYASIDQTITGVFSNYSGSDRQTNVTDSSFTGAGPRLGVNAQFNGRRFQFIGDMAVCALIGTQHLAQKYNTVSPTIPTGNPQTFTSPDATQVVPGLDSKLGTSYSLPIGRGIFKIEAGYQAAIYMNAINSYSLTQVTTTPTIQATGVFMATAQHLQNNFFAHGPYLSTSWAF